MIIEFFGLSNSGKSVLKKELVKEGYPVLKFEKITFLTKIMLLLKSFFFHPIRNLLFFTKLNSNHLNINMSLSTKISSFLLRNSYMASVLAKEEYIKNFQQNIYTDEYFFQSLFMILQKKASKEEINNVLKLIPKSDFLVLFEGNKTLREKAYNIKHPSRRGTLLPGSHISREYGKIWMESMEHNFELVKKSILNEYILENNDLNKLREKMKKINTSLKKKSPELNLKLPSIYRKK